MKLEMHPVIRCKVKICEELLEADNIDSCSIMLDKIMERETSSQREKESYALIIEQASQLSIQLIAEEKVKFQRLQKDQETLIKKQHERAMMQTTAKFYWSNYFYFNDKNSLEYWIVVIKMIGSLDIPSILRKIHHPSFDSWIFMENLLMVIFTLKDFDVHVLRNFFWK